MCYKVDRLLLHCQVSTAFSCRLQYTVLCCRGRMLQTRPRSGVCKPDVMAPKAHQNIRSYMSSVDLLLDSLRKDLPWWEVTRRTLKNHKTVKIGGWELARDIDIMVKNWQLMSHPCTSLMRPDQSSFENVYTYLS